MTHNLNGNDRDSPTGKNRSDERAAHAAADAAPALPPLPSAYLSYLRALRAAWTDAPDLTVTYSSLSTEVQIPAQSNASGEGELPSVPRFLRDKSLALVHWLARRDTSSQTRSFRPLEACSGVVRPGELVLILAPPGHGKTTLLKALAGRLSPQGRTPPQQLSGDLRWNGMTAAECAAAGLQLNHMTAFVEQGDIHYSLLTTRETLQFAHDNSHADVSSLNLAELSSLHANKVDTMLELMGLGECADTIVGNSYIRGVSGGQRRRVGLTEMLMGQARALFLDEISTGLDAAATFNIVRALKEWATVMRGSATMALLQPAPEVVALFTRIILMREGHIVFSGTHAQLDEFLAAAGVAPPEGKDKADWLVEWLAHPKAVYERDCAKRVPPVAASIEKPKPQTAALEVNVDTPSAAHPQQQEHQQEQLYPAVAEVSTVRFHIDADEQPDHVDAVPRGVEMQSLFKSAPLAPVPVPSPSASGPALSTAAMLRVYHSSAAYLELEAEVASSRLVLPNPTAPRSAFTTAQFYSPSPHSLLRHTLWNIVREWRSSTRHTGVLAYRLGQAILLGVIMGSLFLDLGTAASDVSNRLGLVFLAIMLLVSSSISEIPLAVENKMVIYKQGDAGWYPMASYIVSVVVVSIPIAACESLLLGTLIYWMANFVPSAGHYLFFLLVLFASGMAMTALFRSIGHMVPSMDVAMTIVNPVTGLHMLYGGYLLTRDKIQDWQIWLYWTSPFTYTFNSIALNEYQAARYSPEDESAFLGLYAIPNQRGLVWGGVGFLLGLVALCSAFSVAALTLMRADLTSGTRRADKVEEEEEEDELIQQQQQVAIDVQADGSPAPPAGQARLSSLAHFPSSHVQLPFVPVDLAWSDIRYTVRVTEQDEAGKPRTYDRALLQGISGYARRGELTALMGASGAGKTTLMDCLAGRKEGFGTLEGEIKVNGHPQSLKTFRRLLGFVQQDDCHPGSQTVREAVEFSAHLRLPSSVSDEQRERFVTQILIDLELDGICSRVIGDATLDGLSPGELKRLTIAVEMAANPSILFLDEPTSGLDSRAALIVLRVIRKIASRGRSVVATIHQPSADLFSRFDRVLLLKTGGRCVYFGPGGQELVDYFMQIPVDEVAGQKRLPPPEPNTNPAVWMLGASAAGTSGAEKTELPPYADLYDASALHATNAAVIAELSSPRDSIPPPSFDSVYASSYAQQLRSVTRRILVHLWRDAAFSVTKVFSALVLGCILGIVFLQLDDDDESGMLSKVALLFSAQAFLAYNVNNSAQPVIFKLRESFYRERSTNTYAPFVYALATMVAEWPWTFVSTLLFSVPLYLMVGLANSTASFFHFLLICFLMSVVFLHLSQFWSALMPNKSLAGMASELALTICFLFSGVFIRIGDIPRGWVWLAHLSPMAKGYSALVVQQFHCEGAGCPTVETIEFGTVTKSDLAGYYVNSSDPWQFIYIGWLVLTIAVIQLAVVVVVQKVVHARN